MRASVWTLLLGCLLFAIVPALAPDSAFRVRAGNSALPEGTVISIKIDGDGCDCRTEPMKTRLDAQGYATLLIKAACAKVDTTKCKATAVAEITADGKTRLFSGSAKLTETNSGIYIGTVVVVP